MADATVKNRLTIPLMLVLFAALAVFVAITGQSGNAPPQPTPTPTPPFEEGSLLRVFPELRTLDIQAIRLDDLTTGAHLTLSRDDQGHWTAPDLEDDLDEEAASLIARTFVLLPYGRSINIVPATDFEAYGLAPRPQLLFQILNVNGDSHAIATGNLTENGVTYYTLIDERDEIFLVERGPIDFLKNLISSPPIRLTN